jgi:Domain of unknown function (DUF4173)
MRVHFYGGFLLKGLAAAMLVVVADYLFWQSDGIGSNLGAFAAAWALLAALTSPALLHDRRARVAIVVALALAAVLAFDPGLIVWTLFWATLGVAALLPRAAHFGNVAIWGLRLLLLSAAAPIGPWRDLFRLKRAGRRIRGRGLRSLVPLLPLPLIGSGIFLALFASANPLIGDALAEIDPGTLDVIRLAFWIVGATAVWSVLRPRRLVLKDGDFAFELRRVPGISAGSVALSLVLFNALFAVQNGLDIAFLWRGAALPPGMTLADYAHRGAYPLIATALLAGLFVLVALRPQSETARMPLVRSLVILWVAQNVFLVGSTILRTLDYVDAYSLTVLRCAALVWMALVAIGLMLILWRMLGGKTASWLINANAAAAAVALVGCSLADLGEVAAAWNVRHAREAGGKGAALDLCYLQHLGPSALVALVDLEAKAKLDANLSERVAWVRGEILAQTIESQSGGAWTWRNARRLAEVQAHAAQTPLKTVSDGRYGRDCDGSLLPPPPQPETTSNPEAATDGAAATSAEPRPDSESLTREATR